jgi:tetratricopeptide (TPR) repeat protein
LLEDNKPREALVHLYQAQELDEFDGTTWLLIAQALATIGTDKQGMIEAFRKAARFKPDDIKGHYNLASLLFNDGKHYEALPYFIRAYALAREPQVLLNLRTALPQLPFKNPAELMQLSASDWRRGDFDLVEFWLGRALELQADYPPALMDVGRLLLKRERIEEGLDFMRRACEAGKSFGDLVEYGQSLSDAGNLLEAKRIFEQARTVPIPADLREKNRLQLVKRLMEKLEAKLAGKEPSGSPEEGL